MSENESLHTEEQDSSSLQPNALFDMLSKLLANTDKPEAASASGQVKIGQEEKQSRPHSAEKPNTDILSSLLQNPELLSKLPHLISILGPILSGMSGMSGSGGQKAEDGIQTIQKSKSESSPNTSKIDVRSDNRAALLCAMKPYLGRERQIAVDHIIKLSKLGDILKSL